MTIEQLQEKQAQMSNEELILNVERQISDLARTGGRTFLMCVPPEITDTDMILSELVRRFKSMIESPFCPHCHKYKKMQGNGIMHQLCECGQTAP